jgi:hypothetical protein
MTKALFIKTTVFGAGLLVAGMLPAKASFVLTLDDGAGHTASVTDDGAGDLASSTPGAIVWFGALGAWNMNIDVGLSKPLIGGALHPDLLLTVESANSTGPGTLTITLSDTGFGPLGNGTASLQMGGLLSNGSVNASGQVNGITVVQTGPVSSNPWVSAVTGNVTGSSLPFTLQETFVITHTSAGSTGGNADLTIDAPAVPEASTLISGAMLLLPFGAAGFRVLRKRQAS